ncbi:hypothetical protein MNL01_03155 [Bartonella krasnovii]|uniref:Phage protein n=1 Tax=Bartonella krasnovii TaxID=2267275 RepID=A0A5B9D142_9HYPH|nr:hypothetical protein [Bartonella krasnovii]QEE12015.1 phage protein [Bartonella krasnovii]UNF42827.1 hypothetical protein MNL08_03080 [Bartonella krasnovii]UNF47639.1 hypothetical protein MNL05_02935 [Bartonella krasnovii]UNF54326.1 hypothetical protein MNL01_03095 [Bartonella krasnovii]UNF54338.1 hypothetical protein MNL01_03155 [Bartonella krasnovii]
MKIRFNLLSLLILLMVTGCDIENIDKPPRGEVAVWEKPGADFTEVGKALLECGMPHLNYLEAENQKLNNNEIATIYACMVQAGFRKKSGGPYWCYNYKNLPICRPGAVIPKRSVEKRLNSPYCKRSPVQPECKP